MARRFPTPTPTVTLFSETNTSARQLTSMITPVVDEVLQSGGRGCVARRVVLSLPMRGPTPRPQAPDTAPPRADARRQSAQSRGLRANSHSAEPAQAGLPRSSSLEDSSGISLVRGGRRRASVDEKGRARTVCLCVDEFEPQRRGKILE